MTYIYDIYVFFSGAWSSIHHFSSHHHDVFTTEKTATTSLAVAAAPAQSELRKIVNGAEVLSSAEVSARGRMGRIQGRIILK